MAYCSSSFSNTNFAHISSLPHTPRRNPLLAVSIKAVKSTEPENEKVAQTKTQEPSKPQASTTATKLPKKPVYSMKKGQIVRVDKEKYLNSINVLDLKIFETGEYALIAWVGVPTAPAWLPTEMLIKSDKLDYERI